MRRTNRIFRRVLVFSALVIATVLTVSMANKILVTGLELWQINDNISFYNEQAIKSDEMTEKTDAEFQRRELIYQSDDLVVRTYANMFGMLKAVILIMCIFIYPAWALFWLDFMSELCKRVRRRKIRRKI